MEIKSANKPQREEVPPPRKKRSRVLLPVGALIIAGVLITAGWFQYGDRLRGWLRDNTGSPEEVCHFIPVKEFQVNLADTGGRRYLRMKIYFGSSARALEREIEQREPQIRSGIIGLLRCNTVKQLEGKEGMDRLRAEILEQVNGLLTTGQVEEIYFDDFIIQ